jgi:hypothetical protein
MTHTINGFFPGELEPDTVVGGCIDIFENAWPNPQQTIQTIEKACADPDTTISWQRAPTTDMGIDQNVRTNLVCGITHFSRFENNSSFQNIHNQFNMLLLAATIPYGRKYEIHEGFWHEQYDVLKYRPGEEYMSHYDGGTGLGRAVSALVYLNDDYEGGELEFLNFGVKIKPKAGMLVLFPSNYAYRHKSHPVISGTKYALVTWIRDRDTKAQT